MLVPSGHVKLINQSNRSTKRYIMIQKRYKIQQSLTNQNEGKQYKNIYISSQFFVDY